MGHVIALDPTPEQESYFRRACGTARHAYNWGLREWERMRAAGLKPNVMKVKAAWNAHRKANLPWTYEVTKCAATQAVLNLGTAFANFFRDLKKPKKERHFHYPVLKRKRHDETFALWNDQFELKGKAIRVPKLGWVKMREKLRFEGKILGATVSRSGGRWFVSVQVDTVIQCEPAPADTVCGVDLGIDTLGTVSSGNGTVIEKVPNPKPRKRLAKRKKRLKRRAGRQAARAKKLGIKASRRQEIRRLKVSKLEAREANIRRDAAHKFTTHLARQFETVTIEDLNVRGMVKNHAIAGALLDVAPYEIRRQLEYKTAMRGGRVVVAHRFFPSSKLCSVCDAVKDALALNEREWTCDTCGAHHDRDGNAAINLERIGMATPKLRTRGDMGPLLHVKACGKHRGGTANQNHNAHICAHCG
jgi:putative transposase